MEGLFMDANERARKQLEWMVERNKRQQRRRPVMDVAETLGTDGSTIWRWLHGQTVPAIKHKLIERVYIEQGGPNLDADKEPSIAA
jgi:hypothetical protein